MLFMRFLYHFLCFCVFCVIFMSFLCVFYEIYVDIFVFFSFNLHLNAALPQRDATRRGRPRREHTNTIFRPPPGTYYKTHHKTQNGSQN